MINWELKSESKICQKKTNKENNDSSAKKTELHRDTYVASLKNVWSHQYSPFRVPQVPSSKLNAAK